MTEDTNIVDRLAAPDSLLGMLQRGRGEGYLAAMNAPRETVWPLLLECVTDDPRLDRICEDRAEYYASVIRATGMDLAPLFSYIRQNDNPEDDIGIRPPLPLETLMTVAQRGRADAVQMLRDYASFGWAWVGAIRSLTHLGEPAALDGMDEIVCRRITDSPGEHAQFTAAVKEEWGHYRYDAEGQVRGSFMLPICEPWKTLCERNGRLAAIFESIGIAYDQPAPPRWEITVEGLAGLSVKDLFASVNESNYGGSRRVLLEKVSIEDEGLLLENAGADDKYRAMLAFSGLGKIGTARGFETARVFMENVKNADERVRRCVFQAIAEMPGSLTLNTARQWFRRKEWYLQAAAGDILESHATTEDVPMLVEALRVPETIWRQDGRLPGTLWALARFEGIGPIPELEQVFLQAPDCFDRYRAAYAMAVTAFAQFRDRYAFECLWDCHWDTRVHGCETVDLSTPGALERLREVVEDAHEDDDVRQAAQERLEEGS